MCRRSRLPWRGPYHLRRPGRRYPNWRSGRASTRVLRWSLPRRRLFVNSIGIVGSGIAGLHLALFLQQHSVPVTLYSDRTAEQIRAGRLPSTVARFEHTRARERALGVDHWSALAHDVLWTRVYINGQPPLTFRGDMARPWSFVDMRLY